ncbi:motile sperm domain-containing protein 2-like isoform X2 [Tachypleus tridentatus]|uniref:motile sperm domain-containing protein 2-like isoform X2 n=1 Tax=Tachypleus tridentatus TaxID=6853 RepID=UPI003FCEFA3D
MSPLRKTFTSLCKTSTSSDTSVNLQLVTEVRRRIFEEQKGWKDNYDQRDVDRLKQDNWYCARFIKHQKEDIEDSLNMIRDTLKWRKEMGINDLGKENLLAEPFIAGTIGATVPFSCDKAGCRILVMKVKHHKKNSSTLLEQKKFIAGWIEKLDRETNGGRISLLMDCTSSNRSNMDMELIMYITTLFKYYFPFALGYVYFYKMPWLCKALWKILKIRLPAKTRRRFKFINKSSISNYIALDQLPTYLGGSCILDCAIMQSNGEQSEKKVPQDQDFPSPPPPFPGDTIAVGSFLKICPAATLVFPENIYSEPAPVCLTLTNITSNCVGYELKTNSFGIYHIEPPCGVIEPRRFQNVKINLTKGLHCGPTDVITVEAVEFEEEEPKTILKHKFKCVNFGFMLEDTEDWLTEGRMKAVHKEFHFSEELEIPESDENISLEQSTELDSPSECKNTASRLADTVDCLIEGRMKAVHKEFHFSEELEIPESDENISLEQSTELDSPSECNNTASRLADTVDCLIEGRMKAVHKEIALLKHQHNIFEKHQNIERILLLCTVFLQVFLITSYYFSI